MPDTAFRPTYSNGLTEAPLSALPLVPSDWRNKSRADVMAFIEDHGQPIMAARGEVAAAVEKLGALLKRTGGFERCQSVEQYLNDALDSVDAPMGDELRDWCNS